jgi:pyruvate/2-oxoglutarate dehydrogenase complex dihydrolipoamide acyltransferase (E2) component
VRDAIVTEAADFAQNDPEPDRPSSGPTSTLERRGGISMPIDILMPALSPDHGRGQAGQMAGEGGRQVSAGDMIAEIETDKATMEVEAVDEGTVGKIKVAEGTEGVKVNTVIAVLLEDGEDASPAASGSGGPRPRPPRPRPEVERAKPPRPPQQ